MNTTGDWAEDQEGVDLWVHWVRQGAALCGRVELGRGNRWRILKVAPGHAHRCQHCVAFLVQEEERQRQAEVGGR